MSYRVAINGFGRIGRKVLKLLSGQSEIELVAVNDLAAIETLAHLLEFDSVHGRWDAGISTSAGRLDFTVGGRTQSAKGLAEPKLEALPWRELRVDCVVEATGRWRKREQLAAHLAAGAGKVVLTAPASDGVDATVVVGVNSQGLDPAARLLSAASCTTNCLTPIVKVLHESFGLISGLMTTVHAYTNDQVLLDVDHKDLRRARAAAINIVPTTTGAAEAVALAYPAVSGRLTGVALRVPVACGSIADLTFISAQPVSVATINRAIATAAAGELAGIIEYSTRPLVSQDIVGNPHSAVFDGDLTVTQGEHMAKVFAWYDNEWGYSARVADLVLALARMK